MVEVRLDTPDFEQFSNDHYVSLRIGEAQKLAKMSGTRNYKFSEAAVAGRKYGKVEIYKRVGSGLVYIDPSSAKGVHQVVVPVDDIPVRFEAEVMVPGGKKQEEKAFAAPPRSRTHKVATDYLEQHHLEVRLSDAMQAVLRERPADPAAFLAERLLKNSHITAKLPPTKAPAEKIKPPEPPCAAAKVAPAGPTPVVPFGAYYGKHFKHMPASGFTGIHARFQARAKAASAKPEVVKPAAVKPAPEAGPAATPKDTTFAAYYRRNFHTAPAVAFAGLYARFPAPKKAAPAPVAQASAPPAPPPEAPAAKSPLLPSCGSFHGASQFGGIIHTPLKVVSDAMSQAAPPEPAPAQNWAKLPSVGSWLALRPCHGSEASPAPAPTSSAAAAPVAEASKGISTAPAPVTFEAGARPGGTFAALNTGIYGSAFWSMGVRPAMSFL